MHVKKIYMGCPNSGQLATQSGKTFFATHSQNPAIDVVMDPNSAGSLLTQNFNRCWAEALDLRDQEGFTDFLMHHADVVPEDWWLDKLSAIQDETQADILSVV